MRSDQARNLQLLSFPVAYDTWGARSSRLLLTSEKPHRFKGFARGSALYLCLIFLASPVLAQSPVLESGGFTETVLNETGQVNVSVVDAVGFGPNDHGHRITNTFLANTGKARLVQLNGWAKYRYDNQNITGGNATGLIHHSLSVGSGIFWTSSDHSPTYEFNMSNRQWEDDGDRPYHWSAITAAGWLATQDILFISSLENPLLASTGPRRVLYCDEYPFIHRTDIWIPLCGSMDDYIAHSGVASDRTIFVGAIQNGTEAASGVRAGGAFEQHTIYVESPDGSTSHATPVLAAYATNLSAANPAWDAVRLKQELMALATEEILPHSDGGTRVVKVIRPAAAPTFSVAHRTFTVGAEIEPLVLPKVTVGTAPHTYTLTPMLPAGLVFSSSTRTISGTPTVVTASVSYTYTATGANGSAERLLFNIEVVPAVSFTAGVTDQSFPRAQHITPLVLPEATGGVTPITYTLTPALPAGLVFSGSTRTISGTPTVVTASVPYTYTATGTNGSADSLLFNIEVVPAVSFTAGVADQSFPRAHRITPLVLPEATGGVTPITYTLTPALPAGLVFSDSTRTISGTPTVVTASLPYTYTATGANGSVDSLLFSIMVYSPVDAQQEESLPLTFVLRSNFPNPFQEATNISFDLPWPAKVRVDVIDVSGRRVLTLPSRDMAAGWGRSMRLDGAGLASGHYVYRLHVQSLEGVVVGVGVLVHAN